jgi:hypothetical protein
MGAGKEIEEHSGGKLADVLDSGSCRGGGGLRRGPVHNTLCIRPWNWLMHHWSSEDEVALWATNSHVLSMVFEHADDLASPASWSQCDVRDCAGATKDPTDL